MPAPRPAPILLLGCLLAGPPQGGAAQAEERAAAVADLLRTGRQRIEEGRYGEAERVLEGALELAPEHPEALALLGRARALDRRYLGAEGPLRRAVELGRDDPATLYYLGSTLWENGKLAEAEAALRRAVARSGQSPPLLHQLGRLLLWQGRFEEAAVTLRMALGRAGRAPELQLDLARALEGTGEIEAALEAFRRAVELAPEHSEARYGLARSLAAAGRRQAAEAELAVYERLHREDQERTRRAGLERARIDRGRELLRRGEVEAALELLEALPESVEALDALAAVRRSAGDREGAARALERAIALDPARDDLRARLAELRLPDQP